MKKKAEVKTGILISNLGTPDSYSPKDVRKFLKQFLSDPRVIKVPKWIWWFILNGIILNTRSRRSAAAYQKIWTDQGSPLFLYCEKIVKALINQCKNKSDNMHFALGMRYGSPSISDALNALKIKGCERFVILPLYPQYSYTTTASTKDEVMKTFLAWGETPDFKIICDYYDNQYYIDAIRDCIEAHWQQYGLSLIHI